MPERRTLDTAAYTAALTAAVLILWAAWAATKRERELAAYAADCEKDLKRLRDSKREVDGELSQVRVERDRALEGVPQLPTDALVVVTEQGYICPNGLDHPAGQLAGVQPDDPTLRHCGTCDRYMATYDRS